MENVLTQALVNSGTVGIIAYLVLAWKREDEKQARAALETLVSAYHRQAEATTTALNRLTTLLAQIEGYQRPRNPSRKEKENHG